MQQKYLEEQIGAHRKSKKALSAKQRTAKKAGREFPEEDAEQLKHVTEQQSMVQKQLEQVTAVSTRRAGVSEWTQGLVSIGLTQEQLSGLSLTKEETASPVPGVVVTQHIFNKCHWRG